MESRKNLEKEELKECPVCKEKTFKYDSEINANRCYNEFCRWTDKVAPAIDVPMSFLEDCFRRADPGPKKDKIREVIEETKRVNAKYKLSAT